jgi:hypothetical protein
MRAARAVRSLSELAKNSPETQPESLTSFRATNHGPVRRMRTTWKCPRSAESCDAPERIRTSDLRFRRPRLKRRISRSSGTRSGTACRYRTAQAACRATHRATDSPNLAVPHVCLPAARIAPALQTRSTAAPDRWRILVAVEAVARRTVAQQTLAPLVGVRAVHDQPKRPAATRDGAPEVPPNVRILGHAEDQPLQTIWSYAFAGRAIGCLAGRGRRPESDRQERERDGQQPAHMRERSRHTGRATHVRAVRFPYCADTARGD